MRWSKTLAIVRRLLAPVRCNAARATRTRLAGCSSATHHAPPAARFVVVTSMQPTAATTPAHTSQRPIRKGRQSRPQRPACAPCSPPAAFQVITTRESDSSVDLNHRAEIANHAKAGVCLSLHASESGSGVHLFASSLAPAHPARFTALENRAGRLGNAQPGAGRRSQLRSHSRRTQRDPRPHRLCPASRA